jgi:hypothetical protein
MKSPCIPHVSWGRIEAEGFGAGTDFKLYPGGGRDWDWGETNTRHIPGIQPADVEELVEYGAKVIILSRGILLRLQLCPETTSYLENISIKFYIMETKLGVELYNSLARQNVAVGGLFHSTC